MLPSRLAALALGAFLAACSPARPGDVLLITVDTLRADRVGLTGGERDTTPRIDAFFADGAIYERAYATAAATSPSIVSLLSGQTPPEHGVRLLYQLLPDEVRLVSERLPEPWQSAAFVSNAVLTDEALGAAARFDHYDDFVADREPNRVNYERVGEKTTDAALRWLDTGADPARPLFLWVHYIDPHGPYQPPGDYAGRFDHEGRIDVEIHRLPGYQRLPGVDDALVYVDRYDGEVAYLDAQVGRLLDGFAAARDLGGALAILTADHGETLLDQGRERWFAHDWQVFEELVRVPLLLRGPGVRSGRSDAPVSGVDVAPTILRHAGLDPGAGVDLRRPEGRDPARVVHAESTRMDGQWLAAIARERKAMVSIGEDRGVVERRVYDLAADPGEEAPTVSIDPRDPLLASLEALAKGDPAPAGIPPELRRGMRPTAPKVAPGLSPEAEARLRALGYVEDAGDPAAEGPAKPPERGSQEAEGS